MVVKVPDHPEMAKGTLISIMKQARLVRMESIAALKEWKSILARSVLSAIDFICWN